MNDHVRLHATAVAFEGKGVLITGRSGSGKSSLALQLMAIGHTLIADDQTDVTRHADRLWASAPPSIKGMIEARGVGILHARLKSCWPLTLIRSNATVCRTDIP